MNKQQIYQWWDVFKSRCPEDALTEIRILDGSKTYSGYFKDVETLIRCIEPYDSYPHAQIYFTLNRINDACYGRAQKDEIIPVKREPTTGDNDIDGRTHVLIDIDPKRPSGVSSSHEELERAHRKAADIYRWLLSQGFNEPIICKSGNGYHVVIPCQLGATTENTELVKKFIQVVSLIFSDDKVDIDEKVYNASRICKLYGVTAKKGRSTAERPWRMSEIVKVPDEVKTTDIAYFRKVAAMYPEEEVRPSRYNGYSSEKFELLDFFRKHGIGYKAEKVAGGTKYILDHCPFDPNHKHKDAVIFQRDTGAIGFLCFHNSCSGKTWRDVRLLFEPDAYTRRQLPPHRQFNPQREVTPQKKDDDKGDVWQTLSEIEDEDRSKIVSISSGITQYDKECCGYDKPSLNVWSGNNGSGKSSLLNQLALNAVDKGFKVAIYSGELRGKKLKRWMVMQAAGKMYNKKSQFNTYDYYTPKDIQGTVVQWFGDKIFNYNTKYSHDIEQICTEVEKIVKEKGIDMLILDNMSCLDIDELEGSTNDQQKKAIKMILRLTNELEIVTHVVIHPKKSEGFLRKNDISGIKTFTDLADNVFFVHRWNDDTKIAARDFLGHARVNIINQSGASNIVEVIKHREFGDAEGHIYYLYYESESKRFKNMVAESIHYGWEELLDEKLRKADIPSQLFPDDDDCPF